MTAAERFSWLGDPFKVGRRACYLTIAEEELMELRGKGRKQAAESRDQSPNHGRDSSRLPFAQRNSDW